MSNRLFIAHQTVETIENWETALYQVASEALRAKALGALYLKEVVDTVQTAQAMLVLNDDTILFHARPSESVRQATISYLHVKNGVPYFNKTLHHVFLFAAQTDQEHLDMLKVLSRLVFEQTTNHTLYRSDAMRQYLSKTFKVDL